MKHKLILNATYIGDALRVWFELNGKQITAPVTMYFPPNVGDLATATIHCDGEAIIVKDVQIKINAR